MKIEMWKTYKTVGGLPVRVLCVDFKNDSNRPVLVAVDYGNEEFAVAYSEHGEVNNGNFKLVETSIWDGVAVDAKVLVRYSEDDEWKPRHFAKFSAGDVYTWADGGTSYSTTYTNHWPLAKLA